MNNDLLKRVEELFKKWHASGHDINHVLRVSFFAKEIALDEGYEQDEAEVAGLLHDMGRTVQKEDKDHGKAGVPLANELLNTYTNFPQDKIERILDAIEHHSDKQTSGKLANILQDADKLDGMGAIGIFRAGSSKNTLPEYSNEAFNLTADTVSDDPKTLYEQVLFQIRWMDMLYTNKAKEIAQKRHEFMIEFLKQFKREIGESE